MLILSGFPILIKYLMKWAVNPCNPTKIPHCSDTGQCSPFSLIPQSQFYYLPETCDTHLQSTSLLFKWYSFLIINFPSKGIRRKQLLNSNWVYVYPGFYSTKNITMPFYSKHNFRLRILFCVWISFLCDSEMWWNEEEFVKENF